MCIVLCYLNISLIYIVRISLVCVSLIFKCRSSLEIKHLTIIFLLVGYDFKLPVHTTLWKNGNFVFIKHRARSNQGLVTKDTLNTPGQCLKPTILQSAFFLEW